MDNSMSIVRSTGFSFILIFGLFFVISASSPSVYGQQKVSFREHEFGFSLDVFATGPGSELGDILKHSLGFGFFYRTEWTESIKSEVGISCTSLESNLSQELLFIPVHLSMIYKLPLESRLQFNLKGGLGSSYFEVEPANVSGWDPFLLLGFEVSILAAQSLRIGMHFDYFYIYEQHLDAPRDVREAPEVPAHVDDRFKGGESFAVTNSEFIRLGILFGFRF